MSRRDAITINERQLLKVYYDNIELAEIDNNFFLSKEGKILFEAICNIKDNNESINIDTLKKYASDIGNVPHAVYDNVLNTDIDNNDFTNYFNRQKEDYYYNEFETEHSEKWMEYFTKKEKSLDSLKELVEEGEDLISKIEHKDYNISTMYDIIKKHETRLEERNNSENNLTTGDMHLDSILAYPFAPGEITIIGASSGVGKTTFSRNIMLKRVIKRLPTMYFSLEMSEEAFADPSVSALAKINNSELVGNTVMNDEVDDIINDEVFDKVKELADKYKNHDMFYFCDESVLNIIELKVLIKKYIKVMKKKSNYPPVIFIDLMSMLGDFNLSNGNLASVYEKAMNKLHSEIARDLNVHVVGILQLKRPSDKVKIESYEEIFEKLKPSPELLKNSSASLERARQVLLLFRPKHYGTIYLGEDDPECRVADDIMHVYLMKQNRGKLGKVMYLCNFEKNILYPYHDDEQIEMGE